jgi:hypothetical protein
MMATRRYAERRINPFLGVIQVIENSSGRAISTDGVNWEIQLYAERPVGWGSLGTSLRPCLYRHGVWSEQEGLACFPSPPHVQRDVAHATARALLEAVRAAREALPFPLHDHYERWLLDASADGRPLALLEAVKSSAKLALGRTPRWCCATRDAPGLATDLRLALEAQVRARSGQATRSQWFRREPDGSGLVLAARDLMPGQVCDDSGEYLRCATDFPELLLEEHWGNPLEQERAELYLASVAPRLLMLPLRSETRARLEQVAATQALAVDHFHRLYPEILDPALLIRLRVEARLRRGNEAPE